MLREGVGVRGAGGGVRRGGWFQYEPADAPRTRIIADTYVPFRWKASLCPTFCYTVDKKKQRSLALDTRFGRNNATAKRPGMKNWFPERNTRGILCAQCTL